MGLIEVWLNEQGHPANVWGNAKDLLANAGPEFEVIYNAADNFPLPGDILCFNGRWGGGFGHTGVVTRANVDNFTLFEQNNPTGSAPRLVDHPNYSNVQGWMRLKNNQGGEVMNDEAAKEVYRLGLHREPENDQVWRGLVGLKFEDVALGVRGSEEWLTQNHVLLKAYPEAKQKIVDLTGQAQAQQNTIAGQSEQIKTLQAALKDAGATPVVLPPIATTPNVPASPAAPSEPKWANAAKQLRDFFGTTQGRAILGVTATVVTPIVMALQNFKTDNAVLAAAVLAAVTLLNTVKDALNPNVPNK